MAEFIARHIVHDYGTYKEHRFSCMRNFGHKKFRKTVEVADRLYVVDLVNGEMRKKERLEISAVNKKSMARSKKEMRKIVQANEWQYFVTLTFDSEKVDRFDDNAVYMKFKIFTKWVRRHVPDIYYIAVPERHKNGGIHFHMLVGGVTADDLKLVYSGHKTRGGKYPGMRIYNVGAFKYGFSTATKIRDPEACKNYIMKYMRKDIGQMGAGRKRYYYSKNCKKPIITKSVEMITDREISVSAFVKTVGLPDDLTVKCNYLCDGEGFAEYREEVGTIKNVAEKDVDECCVKGSYRSGNAGGADVQVKRTNRTINPHRTRVDDYLRLQAIERNKRDHKKLPSWLEDCENDSD